MNARHWPPYASARDYCALVTRPGCICARVLTPLQSGSVLQGQSANGVTDLIGAIATFAESMTAMKGLVHPLVRLHDLDEGPGCFEVKDSRQNAQSPSTD